MNSLHRVVFSVLAALSVGQPVFAQSDFRTSKCSDCGCVLIRHYSGWSCCCPECPWHHIKRKPGEECPTCRREAAERQAQADREQAEWDRQRAQQQAVWDRRRAAQDAASKAFWDKLRAESESKWAKIRSQTKAPQIPRASDPLMPLWKKPREELNAIQGSGRPLVSVEEEAADPWEPDGESEFDGSLPRLVPDRGLNETAGDDTWNDEPDWTLPDPSNPRRWRDPAPPPRTPLSPSLPILPRNPIAPKKSLSQSNAEVEAAENVKKYESLFGSDQGGVSAKQGNTNAELPLGDAVQAAIEAALDFDKDEVSDGSKIATETIASSVAGVVTNAIGEIAAASAPRFPNSQTQAVADAGIKAAANASSGVSAIERVKNLGETVSATQDLLDWIGTTFEELIAGGTKSPPPKSSPPPPSKQKNQRGR